MEAKVLAETIFLAGVESVMTQKIIPRHLSIENDILSVAGNKMEIANLKNVYVIGAGKASGAMALEIERIFGDKITSGYVVVKYGHGCDLQYITLSEAGHPIPDYNGYASTKKILDIANEAGENDLIICLISGGGSALLCDFPEGSSDEDLNVVNQLLLKSGADIKEINAVRKHLSKVKGGQLLTAAYPAQVITLILSDVIGDSLDAIASGPTVPDSTTFNNAIAVLEKYNLYSKVPQAITGYLQKGSEGIYPETPKPGDVVFNNTHNFVIGSNKIALESCRQKAMENGFNTFIITSELEGDLMEVSKQIIDTALSFQKDEQIKKPCCILFGGETTIKVKGNGTGGRNQHLALYAALLLKDKRGITLLSAGTDGNDGPTDIAGAVVDTKTYKNAFDKGLDANKYLENFDSFDFFEKAGGQIITGPTMTNVMDIIVVIIE